MGGGQTRLEEGGGVDFIVDVGGIAAGIVVYYLGVLDLVKMEGRGQ